MASTIKAEAMTCEKETHQLEYYSEPKKRASNNACAHKYNVVMELVHEILCLESHVWHSSQRNVFVSKMIHFIVVAKTEEEQKKAYNIKLVGIQQCKNRIQLICYVSNIENNDYYVYKFTYI